MDSRTDYRHPKVTLNANAGQPFGRREELPDASDP